MDVGGGATEGVPCGQTCEWHCARCPAPWPLDGAAAQLRCWRWSIKSNVLNNVLNSSFTGAGLGNFWGLNFAVLNNLFTTASKSYCTV